MAKGGGQKAKVAAGGVVIDRRGGEPRVLVVHRPRYDDWSLPKGKVRGGETLEAAAAREVEEETGLRCRVSEEISRARYRYRTAKGDLRPKVVHYFLMEPGGTRVKVDGDEVDRAEWVEARAAFNLLSYRADKETVALALGLAGDQD